MLIFPLPRYVCIICLLLVIYFVCNFIYWDVHPYEVHKKNGQSPFSFHLFCFVSFCSNIMLYQQPSKEPTKQPTNEPITANPTKLPTKEPITNEPTGKPVTVEPTTAKPVASPTPEEVSMCTSLCVNLRIIFTAAVFSNIMVACVLFCSQQPSGNDPNNPPLLLDELGLTLLPLMGGPTFPPIPNVVSFHIQTEP